MFIREDPAVKILREGREAQERQLRETIASSYTRHGYVREGNDWVKPNQAPVESRAFDFGALSRRKSTDPNRKKRLRWWGLFLIATILMLIVTLAVR